MNMNFFLILYEMELFHSPPILQLHLTLNFPLTYLH